LSRKQVALQKVAGLCGIIGPLVPILFIALAISNSLSWFTWTDNALSDLGHQGTAGVTVATIFNSGLILGGLLSIIFAVGLMQILRKQTFGAIGTILLLLLAYISFVAVGVFPETAGIIHFYVSVAFFTFLPISLFFIGGSLAKETSEKVLGFSTILLGIFAAISAAPVILVGADDVAVHELLAALPCLAWSIVLGFKLYRQSLLK